MFIKKYIRKIEEYFFKKYTNIVNLLPISSLGEIIFQYETKFKNNIYKVNFSSFVNVFRVKNFTIDTSTNLIFNNELSYKNFNPIVIWESLDDFIYRKIFKNSLNMKIAFKKKAITINSNDDHLYFNIKNNKPNHYHFIEDNLVALIDFLENYNNKITIVFRDDISDSINQYLNLISKIYKISVLPINKKNNYKFKNLIIFEGNQIKRLRNLDDYTEIENFKSSKISKAYSIYSVPKFYEIKDPINNKIYKVGNASRRYLNSNDSYKSFNNFIKKIFENKVIKEKKGKKILILRDMSTWKKYKPNAKNTKNILNLDDLKNRIKDYEIVYLEKLNIIEQIELFFNASHVICVSGAGLTNIIYSKENTKIFELRPKYYGVHYKYFEDIGKNKKLNFRAIICDCTPTNDIRLNDDQISICANE